MDLIVAETQNHRLLAGGGGKLSVAFLPDVPSLLAPLCLGATRGPGAVFGCQSLALDQLWAPPPTTRLEVTGGEISPARDSPQLS